MSVQFVSVGDWVSGREPAASAEWVAVGRKRDDFQSIVIDACADRDEDAGEIFVVRRGVGERAASVLNRLPAAAGALVVPVREDDLVVLRPRLAEELRLKMASTPFSELLFAAAESGAQLAWLSAPACDDDAASALPGLAPSRPSAEDRWQIDAARAVLSRHPQAGSRVEGQAILAGLLQLTDWLDESHQASQSIEGEGRDRNGDYWHAIMHRREPDYGNSKYWFRHVGRHPIFPALMKAAGEVLGAGPVEIAQEWRSRLITRGLWEPLAFVDLCEEASRDEDSPLGLTARRIQFLEMLLLLGHSWSAVN